MLKPNSFEKMPGKDPANEKQRTYYLDYLLKEKAKNQVLLDESEAKCRKLQKELHDEEIILRTRTKTVLQFNAEQERIRNFVIEEPEEVLKDHPADSELDELEPEKPEEIPAEPAKDLIEVDLTKIPKKDRGKFLEYLDNLEEK